MGTNKDAASQTMDNLKRIANFLVNSYLPSQQWWKHYMYERMGGRDSLWRSAYAFTMAAWEERGCPPFYEEAATDPIWREIAKDAGDDLRRSVRPEVSSEYVENRNSSYESIVEHANSFEADGFTLEEEAEDPWADDTPELVHELIEYLLDAGHISPEEASLLSQYGTDENEVIGIEFGLTGTQVRSKKLTVRRRLEKLSLPERFQIVIRSGQ